ncbi:hypothetical protein BX600DRAFT_457830 [Xylariales sp. PMI_506]|nr:hypothetical protein BX600DRAFT_457830 [Xylariales sp. PMI_506]
MGTANVFIGVFVLIFQDSLAIHEDLRDMVQQLIPLPLGSAQYSGFLFSLTQVLQSVEYHIVTSIAL